MMTQTENLPIPRLEDYDISSNYGFLPGNQPLACLPDGYFAPWEKLIQDVTALLLCGKFRERVLSLEVLDASKLQGLREYQRAFVVLCFLSHSYVWGKNEPVSQALPPSLAIPFCKVSEYLDINPVACNASQVVWNWRLMDPTKPIDLNNLATLHTFTGSSDESWFYLITVIIEAHGGLALSAIIDSIKAVREKDTSKVVGCLKRINCSIENINHSLKRMYEKCDPYLFYWKIRPYLAGWQNMGEAGLPYGVLYQGVDDIAVSSVDPSLFRQYAGGSAGQSSLIQAFDIGLGIAHYPTSEEWTSLKEADQRLIAQGLPPNKPSHTTYLYVQGECSIWYNECVKGLKTFRDIHIQIVTRYIVLPARKGPLIGSFNVGANISDPSEPIASSTICAFAKAETSFSSGLSKNSSKTDFSLGQNEKSVCSTKDYLQVTSPIHSSDTHKNSPLKASKSPARDILYPQLIHSEQTKINSKIGEHGLAKTMPLSDEEIIRGTGGTDLMPFLKQVRDETTASMFN